MLLVISISKNSLKERDKYTCRIHAFLHPELGVGGVGNKEQGMCIFKNWIFKDSEVQDSCSTMPLTHQSKGGNFRHHSR